MRAIDDPVDLCIMQLSALEKFRFNDQAATLCRGGQNAGPRSGDVYDEKSAASGLPDEALYQNQRIGEFIHGA
jgi:hypothetical protein